MSLLPPSGLFGLDIPAILSYGVIGLGFLIALFTYQLLRKEQDREQTRNGMLVAIFGFMAFGVVLCVLGLLSVILEPAPGELGPAGVDPNAYVYDPGPEEGD